MEKPEKQGRVGQAGLVTALRQRVRRLPVRTRFAWWAILQIPELLFFFGVFGLMLAIEIGGFTEPGPPGNYARARLTFAFLAWLGVLAGSVLLLWERPDSNVGREPGLAAVFGFAAALSHYVLILYLLIPPMTWWPLFAFTMVIYVVGLVRGSPMRWGALAYLVLPVIVWILMIITAVN